MTGAAPRTNLGKYGPRILLGGVALGIGYSYFATRSSNSQGNLASNPLRTPGVQNVEAAYQRAGATSTHTKAYGGTVLGKREDTPRDGDGKFGTGKELGFKEHGLGNEQRPWQTGPVGDKFNEMKYGDSRGK
jgi:hypothetical protein